MLMGCTCLCIGLEEQLAFEGFVCVVDRPICKLQLRTKLVVPAQATVCIPSPRTPSLGVCSVRDAAAVQCVAALVHTGFGTHRFWHTQVLAHTGFGR